jgi:para-nitrobenzyl esterase
MKQILKASSGLPRAFLLSVLALSSAAALAPGTAAADPVVETASGPVRGVSAGGVDTFLGIPYAAPPVGDLRWQAPQPAARWFSPRDATQFAKHCAQSASPFGLASTDEDCLYLNVFTPSDAHRDHGSDDWHRLPVMVWIHGGALVVGESDDYDPTRLVEHGVVVVTINYRLGFLGFLAHPALSAESPDHVSGNYGILDQQAALGWVQENIGAFGGDPFRVTIFGESAGGLSVHTQLASPLAEGLFQRAIVESGAYSLAPPTLASAEVAGTALATSLGCTDQTAECLRAVPVSQLLARQGSIASPNVDGKVLRESYAAAFAGGRFNQVPVMEGSNHDEWRLFVSLDGELVTGHPLTAAEYVPTVVATLAALPPATAAFIANTFYPLSAYPSPSLALGALGTDAIFACSGRKAIRSLSRYVPTFAYEFNDENAPQRFLPPVSFPYGAAHASEIQYLFDIPVTVPAPALDAAQGALAEAMVTYWTNFAKGANPNGEGTPAWPAYAVATDTYQSLAPPSPAPETGFAADHKCALWAP